MGEKKAYHLFFSGRVQGVCFRMTAESLAREHNVSGWVSNLADGRVEAFAEGRVDDLSAFMGELKSTFRNNIIELTCNESPATNSFVGFRIRY